MDYEAVKVGRGGRLAWAIAAALVVLLVAGLAFAWHARQERLAMEAADHRADLIIRESDLMMKEYRGTISPDEAAELRVIREENARRKLKLK